MSKFDDIFGEYYDPEGTSGDEYAKAKLNQKRIRQRKAQQNKLNEVGEVPPPSQEILRLREEYINDFVRLHREVFPDSTGLKPFGEKQEKSIYFGQDVFHQGGRLLKLEPRGYAKTTRITNEGLAAALAGIQKYVVIICSNQEKAEEILDSIKTEIYNNDKLEELYPGTIASFRHIDDIPQKARYQTYGGERTYLYWGSKTIRFPVIKYIYTDENGEEREEYEKSSGAFIEVRPMSNTKGLHKKIKAGPDAGKVLRPTLFLIDDPQTHDDAKSETNVRTIISRIKRDALRGGSHSKRASAIMSITPVCPGDVAWHFEKNEQAWEFIKYKMLEHYPINHDWWMNDYASVYLNYDRSVRGDRTRAALEARKLVEENYEMAHEDAVVTWDHAYAWDEEPQTEISPVQHAYNIILDDGIEDFEYECQCNTEYGLYEEGETIHAPVAQIQQKTLPYRRNILPQRTSKLVAHIDVNKDILSYAIVCSPDPIEPHCVDYGTFPKQPGLFSKRNMIVPLNRLYPHHKDYREILYLAVKDLIETLATRTFIREDGVEVSLDTIGVDIRYEQQYIGKAIKESNYKSLVTPCSGAFVGPDDDLLHEKAKADAIQVYENCYVYPNRDRTLDIFHYDANYFKTEIHRAFNIEAGLKGSLTLFGKEVEGDPCDPERHRVVGEHCNSERPERDVGKRTGKTRVVWKEKMHQPDNEFFDNLTNCYALLFKEGLSQQLDPKSKEQDDKDKKMDMQSFIRNQNKDRQLM